MALLDPGLGLVMRPDLRFALAIDLAVDACRSKLESSEVELLYTVLEAIRIGAVTPAQKAQILPILRRVGAWRE